MTPRLYGPFQLDEERIEDNVVANSPGVYALGYSSGDQFVITYLGRADGDLRVDLKAQLGGPYKQFKFTYAISAADGFEKQCELFHQLTGLENDGHPRPPGDLDRFVCPRCKISLPLERARRA